MSAATEQLLLQKRIKPTAMRLLTLQALQKQESAISLSDLELEFERSDRVTLYRTMKTFEEHGMVHAIDDGTGITKYALCESGCEVGHHHDTHVHFYCTSCSETFCLPTFKIPQIKLPEHFSMQEANLTVKGVCDKCSM